MKTDNELIAEFMGGWNKDPHTRKYGINIPHMKNQWWDIDELQYDKSWDWLMPVVAKIAEYRLVYGEETAKVCDRKVVIGHKYLYAKVVEFIKWYNEQKK